MPAAGDTLYLPFSTAVNGAPTLWTGSPAVEVYKNGSLVQSVAGVTVTASFDGVDGQNLITIDTTADAAFYANGGQFRVVVSAGTVGGVSIVGALASEFILALGIQAACAAALAAFFTSTAQLASDVWTSATRLLTAGTNIVLAKGVGVTGFNDLSQAQVNAEADQALADYDGPTNTEMLSAFSALNNLAAGAAMTLTAGERNAIADAYLARSLGTEAVSADGAVPTVAQAFFEMLSLLGEFSISGTTITCKKRDGSTVLFTSTLDSATAPTSRTRAT